MTTSVKTFFQCGILFFLLQLSAVAKSLPVYIEDSHAGSFGFFAQQLDLEKTYTLVLFDAHSDASAIPGSDRVRDAIRRVHTAKERQQKISELRAKGTIQPFNWIEPLMPRPVSNVVWIAGDSLTDKKIAELQKEARVHLDWHLQAEKRVSGMLAERYVVTDWSRFKQQLKAQKLGDVLVSIDLDYFAGMPDPIVNLRQKWNAVLQWDRLDAVSFALSMPWQTEKKVADQLLYTAFDRALSVQGSKIQFEPFLADINDRSEMAKSYFRKGQKPPRYKVSETTMKLRQLVVRHRERINVEHNTLAWEETLRKWSEDEKGHKLEIRTAQQSVDGVWRLKHGMLHDIWVCDHDDEVVKVRWWLHQPEQSSYNIIPRSGLGKGFAANAPAYIISKRNLIAETEDQALSSRTWRQYLHTKQEIGVVRIQAELVRKSSSIFTGVMEIRVRRSDGFLGALEEQFGSPYVFGIGSMKHNGESGPETLLGNDCANFLVYAFRRTGRRLPWCNPEQIKRHLVEVKGDIEVGDVVHLGGHVAIVYRDVGLAGKLDNSDTLVHHLSGFPEFATIDLLAKDRPYKIMRWKTGQRVTKFFMGGDVCLHSKPDGMPLSMVTAANGNVVIANLECVISDRAQPAKKKRFNYIVPLKDVSEFRQFEMISMYSLANNHAGDGGVEGLRDTMNFLDKKGIKHFGAGTLEQATAVKVIEVNSQKIGLLGMNLIEPDVLPATENTLGVATYPLHREAIAKSIQKAKLAGIQQIIAMPHWGDEYTRVVNDQQRALAKWLIQQGVDGVVGAHSHMPQHNEFYRGKPIYYSRGNLIFSPQRRYGFGLRSLLEVSLDTDASFSKTKLLTTFSEN